MNKIYRVITVVIFFLLSACGSPQSEFRKVINSFGYIAFELPMAETRVGTVVRGNAREMYIVARPEQCFPDLPGYESLRWVQPTDLPDQYKKVTLNFNADANATLGSGNAVLTFNTNVSYVKTVSITFKGAAVEFLNELNFQDFYMNQMSERCKSALSKYPFILQALHINEMEFVFKDEFGVEINLGAEAIKEIVKINAGVHWSVEQNYILKITTPKFIGYRLGTVDSHGVIVSQSAKTDSKGKWVFKPAQSTKSLTNSSTNKSKIATPLLKKL